jgi:hypothetical protein
LGALKDCEKLREAYINAVMPIDLDIDKNWNLIVRGPLDKILDVTFWIEGGNSCASRVWIATMEGGSP